MQERIALSERNERVAFALEHAEMLCMLAFQVLIALGPEQ